MRVSFVPFILAVAAIACAMPALPENLQQIIATQTLMSMEADMPIGNNGDIWKLYDDLGV